MYFEFQNEAKHSKNTLTTSLCQVLLDGSNFAISQYKEMFFLIRNFHKYIILQTWEI